ncbi:hypothetical protein D8771_20510 [Streptomyces albus]|uniref:Uncharacterized protein n=1 Tax=Streptomyces albus TaxID=1888 RepID=A0A8H1QNR0_9ACTN|nr:MaoC/PaaZ C-terminal domain-containing protein [Streptomyces albus]TGG80904.1 hypothetical protein D8771_20510 [Streptomyces albus]UVN55427.1 MaoC/PaaZ C-terminal domain-containing protein [Streptomyces albus]
MGNGRSPPSSARNPIHLRPLTARACDLPHTVTHGMWTFARGPAEYARRAVRSHGGGVHGARPAPVRGRPRERPGDRRLHRV